MASMMIVGSGQTQVVLGANTVNKEITTPPQQDFQASIAYPLDYVAPTLHTLPRLLVCVASGQENLGKAM